MALEHVSKFIHKLNIDKELRHRFEAFIANEGFSFTLNEIMIAEREEKSGHSFHGPNNLKPLSLHLCGYENWVG